MTEGASIDQGERRSQETLVGALVPIAWFDLKDLRVSEVKSSLELGQGA